MTSTPTVKPTTYTFPQAFAICAWDRANNCLPKHTDGMVRKALQLRGFLDDNKLLTAPGQVLLDAIAAIVAEAAQNVDKQRVGHTTIAKNAPPERDLAAKLLVIAGFAAWGAVNAQGERGIRINRQGLDVIGAGPTNALEATGLVSGVTPEPVTELRNELTNELAGDPREPVGEDIAGEYLPLHGEPAEADGDGDETPYEDPEGYDDGEEYALESEDDDESGDIPGTE
jgi:hypothetical protein